MYQPEVEVQLSQIIAFTANPAIDISTSISRMALHQAAVRRTLLFADAAILRVEPLSVEVASVVGTGDSFVGAMV
jgi:fructose-1-phosphate kinase PfkB-like protein